MKMIIVGVSVAVVVAMMIIFFLALAGAAAARTPYEQFLDDEDQVRYIAAWREKRRISGSGKMNNI